MSLNKKLLLLLVILLGAGLLFLLAKYHCAPKVAKSRGISTQVATNVESPNESGNSLETLNAEKSKPQLILNGKSYFSIEKDSSMLKLMGIVSSQEQLELINKHLANESTVAIQNKVKVSTRLPPELVGKAEQIVLASSLLNKASFSLGKDKAILVGDVNTSVNKTAFERNIRSILKPISTEVDLAASGLEKEGRACQSKLIKMLSTFSIQFEFASADISTDSLEALDKLTAVVAQCGDQRFSISGHTDNTGSPEANLKLSQARANSIKNYLISKGVETNRVNAVGYGETQPIDANDSDAGRQNNRRIEITVLPK